MKGHTLYCWKYDNSSGSYRKFNQVIYLAQLDQRDIIACNSEAEMEGAIYKNWAWDVAVNQPPDRMPASSSAAGLDFLNLALASPI